MAALTALKRGINGKYHLGHWWRGPLLYGLVQYYKPKHILEFGTGRGYGAICMAQAARDIGLDCVIWTVDLIPPSHPQKWAIDEGKGPMVKEISLNEVWETYLPGDLRKRINLLTGNSHTVMNVWHFRGLPKIDFCFIDGGHDYLTVKHDFMAGLSVANEGCAFLFDDYTFRKRFGVNRLVDGEIMQKLPGGGVEILDTLTKDQTVYGEEVPHLMVLLRGEVVKTRPLGQFYSKKQTMLFRAVFSLYFRLPFKLMALISRFV